MKHIIIILLLSVIYTDIQGSPQCTDVIIYNGDTLRLHYYPFENHPEEGVSDFKYLFGDSCIKQGSWGCIRGYIATWEIDKKGQLYLTRVSGGKGIDANLKDVFSSDYKNGKVEVNWFSGNILAVKGNVLVYIHQTFESVYETEIEFSIKDGQLKQVKTYDNSKACSSSYPGEAKLVDYLVANTNHCLLPDTTERARVYVQIDSVGDNKKIEKVTILKGYSDKCDEEAIRVVKSIPEWEVIYRKGKPAKGRWRLPITFEQSKCTKI